MDRVLEIAGITGHTLKTVEHILKRYLTRTSKAATDKRLAASAEIRSIFILAVDQD